jgi:transcriptional regulator with XRE-family HTH domain
MTREEIIALRKRLGLKQITVARYAVIERTRYSLWENAHLDMSQDELNRVARVLTQELDLIRKLPIPLHQAVAQ